jgi:hypothetical protein
MAGDRSGERAALDAEVEETQGIIARLRAAADGTPPGLGLPRFCGRSGDLAEQGVGCWF